MATIFVPEPPFVLWCCNCISVIHTLILCKIWQYEINHLKSQICTFTGCMSDHLLSTQLLNMYRMPHRTILALSFWIFSKGWEDVGYSNQWYIKNWRSYKDRLYWKQKFWIKIQIWDSFWILTDVPFGPPWTWAPRNLVHLVTCVTCFSGDPN